MSAQPQQPNFAAQQAKPGSAKSGSEKGQATRKSGDGGFYTALAGFILLLLFFFLRTGTGESITLISKRTKILLLGAAVLLDFYSFFRKLRHHDYSYRQYFTNVIIWMTLIFSVPGLLYYLFLS